MKRVLLWFVLGAAAACGAAEAGDDIAWRTDLGAARAEARESGRPLLVVFR